MCNYPIHYIAANKDINIRKKSSSGGIFTALAEYTFMNSGAVYAAAFISEECFVKHIRITSLNELDFVRKSKYVWSDISEVDRQIIQDINNQKNILFVGTPCQAMYIKKKYGEYKGLIIVDLFCHGTAKMEYFGKYMSEINIPQINNVDFRGQKKDGIQNYQFQVFSGNEMVVDQAFEDNLFTRAYSESLVLRDACFNCDISSKIHCSDLTLGDFEWRERAIERGVNVYHPSFIAVNTETGNHVFSSIQYKLLISSNIFVNEIKHYYRRHTDKGSWGYNIEWKEIFEKYYLQEGFSRSAYKVLYPAAYELIDKLSNLIDKNKRKYYLYGNGKVAKLVSDMICKFHPDWQNEGTIVTKISNNKCGKSQRLFEVRSIPDNTLPIAIAVSTKYIDEIINELEKNNIQNYVFSNID